MGAVALRLHIRFHQWDLQVLLRVDEIEVLGIFNGGKDPMAVDRRKYGKATTTWGEIKAE